MVVSLLSTKFTIPPTGAQRIERLRLVNKLDGAWRQGRRFLLVSAPAGYGKTTLVSQWVNQLANSPERLVDPPVRVAWLTCDAEDGDLARFVSYWVAALRQANLPVGEGVMLSLQATKPPAPETLAILLVNELANRPERSLLVLDDLHTLESQPVLDFLAFFIEHQPPQFCLVVVTRADPGLPLARLRGRGQMDEVRQNDLAFSLEESAEFLGATVSTALTRDQLVILEQRTEGWAAGLQLAALSMQSAQDIPAFIEAFSGGYEYIADYLTDEVLARQPDEIHAFLLETAILERFSAPLCAAVTGNPHARQILEILREKNLFLVSLDHQKEWYRYHALFTDILRNRLRQTQGERVIELYRRAGAWHQQHGDLVQAIEYELAGQAVEQAAVLMEPMVEPVFISGQLHTLQRWLDALPDEIRTSHPILWIFQGLTLAWCGNSTAAVKAILPELDGNFKAAGLTGESCALQALLVMTEGRAAEAAVLARRALQELPVKRAFFRCLAADTLGMAEIMRGENALALQAFDQLAQMAEDAGFAMFEIVSLAHKAGLRLQAGQIHAAGVDYRHVHQLARQKLGPASPVMAKVLLGLGEVARERHDLDEALRYFLEAAEVFNQFGDIGVPIATLSAARVKATQGDWEAAEALLEKARQCAQASKVTRLNERFVEEVQARFWIDRGLLNPAEQWARERGLLDRSLESIIQTAGLAAVSSEFVYTDYLLVARLHLAQGKPDAALRVIDGLLDVANRLENMRRVMHLLALKAIALHRMDDTPQALAVLGQALDKAGPEGYLQVFLDEGEPMAQLLRQNARHGYARKLLGLFAQMNEPPDDAGDQRFTNIVLLDPLSDRELEVLALIAAGLSNREISLRLHITLSTVKGHASGIYGKLGVNSRTQALSEAARLGLLSS